MWAKKACDLDRRYWAGHGVKNFNRRQVYVQSVLVCLGLGQATHFLPLLQQKALGGSCCSKLSLCRHTLESSVSRGSRASQFPIVNDVSGLGHLLQGRDRRSSYRSRTRSRTRSRSRSPESRASSHSRPRSKTPEKKKVRTAGS